MRYLKVLNRFLWNNDSIFNPNVTANQQAFPDESISWTKATFKEKTPLGYLIKSEFFALLGEVVSAFLPFMPRHVNFDTNIFFAIMNR
ncbi:MAG: hypothetical protein H6636_12215 [Anaerolineales bacterium]|nr:hypothetical protein [Anaerolineales bacterium]